MSRSIDLSFYLVLDPELCKPLGMVETTRLAILGGVTAIQLRHKSASTEEMVKIGRKLQALLEDTDVSLVINDDYKAAQILNADALHIGQGDIDVSLARDMIGWDMVLGLSVETAELSAKVDADIVDYVGAGPVFATPTKPDHKEVIGFDGLAQIVKASSVPVVAIGGLKYEHIADTFSTGADGIAVVSAICGQENISSKISEFDTKIREVYP